MFQDGMGQGSLAFIKKQKNIYEDHLSKTNVVTEREQPRIELSIDTTKNSTLYTSQELWFSYDQKCRKMISPAATTRGTCLGNLFFETVLGDLACKTVLRNPAWNLGPCATDSCAIRILAAGTCSGTFTMAEDPKLTLLGKKLTTWKKEKQPRTSENHVSFGTCSSYTLISYYLLGLAVWPALHECGS